MTGGKAKINPPGFDSGAAGHARGHYEVTQLYVGNNPIPVDIKIAAKGSGGLNISEVIPNK